MKPFKVAETYQEGIFMIKFEHELFSGISGSLNIIGARVLGFSYPNYLRYMRDNFSAEIRGREGYPYPIFKDKACCNKAVTQLNDIWGVIERTLTKELNEVLNNRVNSEEKLDFRKYYEMKTIGSNKRVVYTNRY